MSPPQTLPSCSLSPLCLSSHPTVASRLATGCVETRYASCLTLGRMEKRLRGRAEGVCASKSRVCASLHRMTERSTSSWSAGGWVLALCLAWLWTRLASASLQPPTSTGLGKVVTYGEGFYRMSGDLEGTPVRSTKQADLWGRVKSAGVTPPVGRYPGNCPLPLPSLEKAWEGPLVPSLPGGRCSAVRPSGRGLSLVSWPNSGVFLLGWLKPL